MPKSINIQKIGAGRLLGKGVSRHVQGIASSDDDLKLLGESFKANVDSLLVGEGVTLSRTIEAASTVTIALEDRDQRLLTSKLLAAPFHVELDGLMFRFVAVRKEGDVLTLTFEPRNVARLRMEKGAMKVFRGKWTRQEFVAKMVTDVRGDPIPLYTPDLHKRRPIADDADAGEDGVENDVARGHGINDDPDVSSKGSGKDANLTVKHVAANSEQLKNGDTVLRVGESLNAPRLAMEACIVSGIQENNMTNADAGPGCRGYFCIIDSTAAGLNYNPLDLAAAAKGFYTDGWTGTPGGAIALAKKGGMSAAEISSAVEGNEAGASDRYQWESEAKKWVDFFVGGGVLAEGGGGDITASSSVSVEVPYAFERKADESTWAAMQRLAEEVNFRAFESANVIYFVAEPRLMESKLRMRLDANTDGLLGGLSFDYDPGRRVNEVTFNCLTRAWAAPPGTVVQVDGHGPANGRYLVSAIDSNLTRRDDVSITLRRASPPDAEPAPETKTKTVQGETADVGGGEISGSDHERLQKMIDEADRMTALKVGYVYGGGHTATPDPDGPWDCSAAVSRVLYAGGFLDTTLATTGLNTWGASGTGKYCTVYVRNGGIDSAHTIMRLKGRLFGTGGENPGGGAGWLDSTTEAYVATLPIHRHPPGL